MLDIILEEFHFSSLWNGGIFLLLSFTAIIYLFLLPHDQRHSIWKNFLFLVGLLVLFLGIGSPINIIGRIEFSTHIIQVVLLLLAAPPLLILGFKQKTLDKVVSIPFLKKLARFLLSPIFAMSLFYVLLYVYHLPSVFDYARVDLFWNYFYMLGLFISAVLLWAMIIARSGYRKKMMVAVLNFVLIIPFGLVLYISNESFYTIYTDMTSFVAAMELCLPPGESLSPECFALLLPFDPVGEQKQGGIILLVSQAIIFGSVIVIQRIMSKSKRSV